MPRQAGGHPITHESHPANTSGTLMPLKWAVDVAAAGQAAGWVVRRPELLEADLIGMATYFPHWLVAGSQGENALRCRRCGNLIVPTDGAMHCAGCQAKATADGLFWLGQLPVLVRSDADFAACRERLGTAGYVEVQVGGLSYLLVPLVVYYPREWPNDEPSVCYAPRWLRALGLPQASASHHLLARGRACLFAWRQWTYMPIHEVIQQRVVNHVISLLKIVAGQPPHQAFIGRTDHGR